MILPVGNNARVAGLCAVLGMLWGCAGSQPSTAAGAFVPPEQALSVRHAQAPAIHGSTDGSLIYATDGSKIYVYSYPAGTLVTQITKYFGPYGACGDSAGNVYVMTHIGSGRHNERVEKFAHGGTTAISSIAVPRNSSDCAVDPNSTDFAVAGTSGLWVYAGGKGPPHLYSDPNFFFVESCVYDNAGNIFLSGISVYSKFILAELPKGGDSLVDIATDIKTDDPTALRWDGEHLAVIIIPDRRGGAQVKQLEISGSSARSVGKVHIFPTKHGYFRHPYGWIDSNLFFWTYSYEYLGVWDYSQGGKPLLAKKVPQSSELWAIVLSRPPSR